MSRRRFGRWVAVLMASAVALVAPIPQLTPAAQADPANPLQTTVNSYLSQKVAWGVCPAYDDFDEYESRCARVRVPMDWKNPSRGSIWVAIAYLKSTSATSRGLLTTNPGGPSVPGRMLSEALSWSKPNLRQYDLLGFDPRGFGASTRVQCRTRTKAEVDKLPKVADLRVRNRATHAVEVAEAKLFGKACGSDPVARYINTQQTVWDLDFLRQLVAGPTAALNYIGYSYGTWLGAWYADTYPQQVGKFVLDSNMSWTTSMYANQALDPKSFQRRRDKMLFPYLARHNSEYKLGKSAKSVKKTYESTRTRLVKQAKKDLKKHKVPALGPEDFDFVVSQYIYTNYGFDSAGALIKDAVKLAKHPTSVAYRRAVAKRIKTPMKHAPFIVQRSVAKAKASSGYVIDGLAGAIVTCNDSANPGNLKALQKRTDRDAKRYPFVGYLNTIPLCSYWKYKPQTRTIDLAGVSKKLLMIQSEGDPATAYEGALASHRKTASKTVLVSVDNEGQHGLYIDGPSRCVESTGDAFLFRNQLPSRDTRCTTSPLFFDSKVYPLSGPVSGASSNAKRAVLAKNRVVKRIRADAAKRGLS